MYQYFTANQPHLQDHIDISSIYTSQSQSSSIISLGIDSLIYIKNFSHNIEKTISLKSDQNYKYISKCNTKQNTCYLATQQGSLSEFNLENQTTEEIYQSASSIREIILSPKGKYLSLSTQQSKPILIHPVTHKPSKCRPGHQSSVISTSFDNNQHFIASIGEDKNLLIYNIDNFDQPLQLYRNRITKSDDMTLNRQFKGSWNKFLSIYYCPGQLQLQIIELLNLKWQHRLSSLIKHPKNIIHFIQTIKNYVIVTSSISEIILWNNKNQEKIVNIQETFLYKMIQIDEKVFAVKADGKIYQYNKVIVEDLHKPGNKNKMQIQDQDQGLNIGTDKSIQNNNDIINFDNQSQVILSQQEAQKQNQHQQIKQNVSQQQLQYQNKNKSKVDRIIKVLPQQKITNNTSLSDGSGYLYTNQYGYVIQRIQSENQTKIQYESEDEINNQILFVNKNILYVELNGFYMIYADQTSFGIKFLGKITQFDSWEEAWWDVTAVTGSGQWVAVANQEEIKIFDLIGNQLKSICFDRQIIGMTAYQNILAVVYHQSVPIWGHQCLAMQLYVINPQKGQVNKFSTCHVPIKPKSRLKYFRFSNQGMLTSQDTNGQIRVYNLQYNCWSSVIVDGIQDTRRLWLLGMRNYQLIYWRTTEITPDPQVFPRLPIKRSKLGINSIVMEGFSLGEQIEQSYPYLMFQRFCLDHERCRGRLWRHLLVSRSRDSPFYENILNIKDIKTLMKHHNQLDIKFFSLIKYYIKQKQYNKLIMTAKSLIRTIEAGKELIQLIDQCKLRHLAVELEKYYDQKQKQLEYQAMQQMDMQRIKSQAQKSIKPKAQNPFAAKKNKNNNQMSSIPSLNNSQFSQGSNFDNYLQRSAYKPSKQNGINITNKVFIDTPQKQEISNPFAKKGNNQGNINMKNKQIEEQIQKCGIKKKTDIKKSTVGHRNF